METPATASRARDPRIAEVDRAIAAEDGERATRRSRRGRRAAAPRLLALPRLLRWMGASVLVAAAFTFMLQNWERGDDVARTFHFLGFTGVLAAAGFFCGLRIGDEKSARTFLGLAVGAVPVHFTVLGALLYSQFPWLSGYTAYPDYAHFSAPNQAAALLATGVGFLLLIPVCWAAFLAFARPRALALTGAFLLANAALLVPTRHPDLIGLLALALLAATVLFDRRWLQGVQALRTSEGAFTRLLMAVPFLILVGRTLNLYDPSSFFLSALMACLAVVLFLLLPSLTDERGLARLFQGVSLVPTAAAWLLVVDALQQGLGFGASWLLPLCCLPIAGLFAALSLRAVGGGAGMRRLAAVLASGGMLAQLVLFPSLTASFWCLAIAIATSAYGFAAEQRGVFLTGLAAMAFGLLYHVRYAADLYALSPWGSLAVLGIVTVLAAAVLERHHRALVAHVLGLRERMAGWSS